MFEIFLTYRKYYRTSYYYYLWGDMGSCEGFEAVDIKHSHTV